MAGLARGQYEFGSCWVTELDDASQRRPDGLGIRIRMTVEANVDRHTISRSGNGPYTQKCFENGKAAQSMIHVQLMNLAPAPRSHIGTELFLKLAACFAKRACSGHRLSL